MNLEPTQTDPDKYAVIFENEMPAGRVAWLAAQEHSGENVGVTDTHVVFVELKEPGPQAAPGASRVRVGRPSSGIRRA